jgi:hypothetical protein
VICDQSAIRAIVLSVVPVGWLDNQLIVTGISLVPLLTMPCQCEAA